jgi:alkylation response protein AidB-like acyl-CoA dehydrogenase
LTKLAKASLKWVSVCDPVSGSLNVPLRCPMNKLVLLKSPNPSDPAPAIVELPVVHETLSRNARMAEVCVETMESVVIEKARQLGTAIRAHRDDADRLRHVPPDLSDAIAASGLYHMFLPASLGGSELPPLVVFRAIEEVARADGSVGWCVLNANFPAFFTAWLPHNAAQAIVGSPPRLRAAGSIRPQGRARPVPGGYSVDGQWNFMSGMLNANWLYCTSLVMEGDKPKLTASGKPDVRGMWVAGDAAAFVDTWSVMGMRGTGSHDCRVQALFVPSENSCALTDPPIEMGLLYRPRTMFTWLFALFAANALGIARGAIDELIALATDKASTLSEIVLRDRPAVQARVAEAEAIVNGARCYALDSLARLWGGLEAHEEDLTLGIAHARLAITHAIRESARAVDLAFHAAGTNAIFTTNPLERSFRDIHVAIQHNTAMTVHFESAGKVLMGLQPMEPGW